MYGPWLFFLIACICFLLAVLNSMGIVSLARIDLLALGLFFGFAGLAYRSSGVGGWHGWRRRRWR